MKRSPQSFFSTVIHAFAGADTEWVASPGSTADTIAVPLTSGARHETVAIVGNIVPGASVLPEKLSVPAEQLHCT